MRSSTQRLIALLVVLLIGLVGCQGLGPAAPSIAPSQQAPAATRASATDLQGQVDFSGVRQAQATPADVVGSATVSFIDLLTNATVATGKTNAAGAFSLSLAGYHPEVGRFYLLEAVKGLSNQAPGAAAARFRTVLRWSGVAWLSCTNAEPGGRITINALTTALALQSALDPLNVPPSGTLGKVDATQTPAVLLPDPTFPGHPDTEIAQLAADLLSYLGAEADPVASVPAILPAIASLTPGTGMSGSLVRILGTGFSPAPSGNVVTFGSLGAPVLLATPTSLLVVVPAGATTGPVRVRTGRGTATGATFVVASDALETGILSISGFSPTFGRADTVVTLSGEFGGVGATPSVTFAGAANDRIPAPVLAWSPTEMTVAVPVGSVPGPIAVRSGIATGTSIGSFDVWQGDVSLMNNLVNTAPGSGYTYPASIYGHSTATYGSPPRYHYVIGGYANSASQFDVRMYPVGTDGQLGSVRWVGRLNVARHYPSSAVVGDWLYVFGGENNLGAGNYGGGVGPILKSIERARINADGTLSKFTLMGDVMNQQRQSHRVIARGTTLYVLGGNSGAARNDYERHSVDLATGALTFLGNATMNVAGTGLFSNYQFGCQLVGDAIVLVGGYLNGAHSPKCITLPIKADGSLDVGTYGPNLNVEHYATQTCVIGEEIYVLGGYYYNGTSWVYHSQVAHSPINPTTGVITGPWVYDSPSMGWNVSYTDKPLVADKLIYTIGGYGAGGVIQAAEVMPNKSLSRWTQLGGTRESIYLYGSLMLGNRAWRIGGYTTTDVDTTEYYPIGENGSWGAPRYGPSLKSARYYPGISVNGNFLYVVGGRSGGSTFLDTIERATIDRTTGEIGPFAYLPVRLNQPRNCVGTVVIGPYLYAIGGYNAGTWLNSIERARINPDGSLSPFEQLATALPYSISCATPVVIGDYVYLLGMQAGGSTPLAYVLCARIFPDGSLGQFTRSGDMNYAVYTPSVARIGNYLWAFGGYNAGNYSTGQRAPIRPDGTLGPWETPQPGGRHILAFSTSHLSGPAYLYKDWIFLASGYSVGVNVNMGSVR